jgi:methylase of polypeptide subunit release factors
MGCRRLEGFIWVVEKGKPFRVVSSPKSICPLGYTSLSAHQKKAKGAGRSALNANSRATLSSQWCVALLSHRTLGCVNVRMGSVKMDAKSLALIVLGKTLKSRGYYFVTVTPATHCRVLDRPPPVTDLQSVFGWNWPFDRCALDPEIFDLLEDAEALERESGRYKSKVRFATIGDLIFAHSAFPTAERDAVFFGPDTYRFVRLLRTSLADVASRTSLRLIDVGSGSGAGGIAAARLLGSQTQLVLSDISPKALAFSALNAVVNDVQAAQTVLSDVLTDIEGAADIIVANPPYLVDADRRLYRHGGGGLGISLAVRIVEESLDRLKPGGRLILYSGTPIIAGLDSLFEAIESVLKLNARHFSYEEIDPDVFGEELDRPAYVHADRIAAIGLTATK